MNPKDIADVLKRNAEDTKTLLRTNAELLRELGSIHKDIGELSVVTMALHSTLCALLPDFSGKYELNLASERIQRVKQQYEHRIRVLLEQADRMSKN